MKKSIFLISLILTLVLISQKTYSQSQLNLNGKYKNSNGCIITISKHKTAESFYFEFTCNAGICEGQEGSGVVIMTSENSAEYYNPEYADEKPINFDLSKNKIVFKLPENYLGMKCEMSFDKNFIKIVPTKFTPKK